MNSRIALSALLVAASISLSGCVLVPFALHPPTAAAPTPSPTAEAGEGYVYTDNPTGYSIVFPEKPDTEDVDVFGTAQKAHVASWGDEEEDIYFFARGEIHLAPVDLRGTLLSQLADIADGQIGASSYELDGLQAVRGEVVARGKDLSMVLAQGDGNRVFLLVAAGGTPEDRDAFFDSFEYLA